MKTIFFPDENICDGHYAATIGFFDGVHRGHRYLLEHLKKQAALRGLSSMAITFEQHPRHVAHPEWQPELLSMTDDKIRFIEESGIDLLVILRFDAHMASLSAHQFMMQVLRQQLHVSCLLTGYDNRFGHDRTEGFEDYCRYGRELGIEVTAGQPLSVSDSHVSSSRIRHLLKKGLIEEANACLGYPYFIRGMVVHGQQIGRTIGFPTANLQPHPHQLIPANGVYAVWVDVNGQQHMPGVMNIGTRPTFDGEGRTIETNIIDGMGDFYDQPMRITILSRLRGEQHFPSAEALTQQIQKDKEQAKHILKKL